MPLATASLGRDWSTAETGPLQNPLMHLAEAFLATLSVRDDAAVRQALLSLCEGMFKCFVDPQRQVMMEKPLAVNLDHAKQMETLARKHGIHLLTNYETTWYGSNADAVNGR